MHGFFVDSVFVKIHCIIDKTGPESLEETNTESIEQHFYIQLLILRIDSRPIQPLPPQHNAAQSESETEAVRTTYER